MAHWLTFLHVCSYSDVQYSQMPKAYSPNLVEEKWYEWWESNSFFQQKRSALSGEKFSMVLPPPNITGTLHLGHALTCAIQDSLVCWYGVTLLLSNLNVPNS